MIGILFKIKQNCYSLFHL